MSDHSDDQRKKWEERQRGLEQVRKMLGEALVAHEMSDAESQEVMTNIDAANIVDAEQKRLENRLKNLPDEDPLGYAAFGDRPGWIDKHLDD